MIVNNLNEFLNERGFDDPYDWARCLYKYTDCGPWVNFIKQSEPKKTKTYNAVLKCDGKDQRPMLEVGKLPTEVLRVLCLDDREEVPKWDEYCRLLDNWCNKHPAYRITRRSIARRHLEVDHTTPEIQEKIYYEHIHNDTCVGIIIGLEVGSIVEGSDVEIGPYDFYFPFDTEDFDNAIKSINDEATFYWERDNYRYFNIKGKRFAHLTITWDDPIWLEDKGCEVPEKDKKLILDFLNNQADEDGLEWIEYNKPKQIGDYTVTEYCNDEIY